MPWKTDEEGHVTLYNGNPVWLDSQGSETAVDFERSRKDLSKANREAQERRERIAALEEQIAPWSELELSPSEIAERMAELDRLKKAAQKAGDDTGNDPEGLKAQLAEATETIAQLKAQADKAGKDVKTLQGENETLGARLHKLTVGRAIRASKWFAKSDGNDPLTTVHPDIGEDYLSAFGEPHPDEPGKVLWYNDPAKKDTDHLIRDDEGHAADANFALGVLGPKFPWWQVRDSGAGGAGTRGAKTHGTQIPNVKFSDLRTDQQKHEFIEKYGAEAYESVMQRGV